MATNEKAESPVSALEHAEGRRDLAWALIVCLVAVVVVRSFLFEPFKIPSPSMVPTLRKGDHIFVSKFSYSLSVPFTKYQFLTLGKPKRGDVIVFLFPKEESLHYIKRVVGLPGDRIEFKGKDLYVNEKLVPRERVTDPTVIEKVTGSKEISGELYKETLDGVLHYVSYSKSSDFPRSLAPIEIPEGQFYVLGDNRDDSYDSRSWGFVPMENIKGKAQMIWLSLEEDSAWGSLAKVRWSRCGVVIH